MIKQSWIITIVIFTLAFALRFNHFTNNSPFDWDQNRDYGEVAKIATGKLPILGPVAKGEGGFYLGSLYYYLLYPAYYFMSGSLSSLPLISLSIDAKSKLLPMIIMTYTKLGKVVSGILFYKFADNLCLWCQFY